MRLLVAIPHVYRPASTADGRAHGSTGGDPAPRVEALTSCIAALHQLFGPTQCMIDQAKREAKPVNATIAATQIDVVVCTTRGFHLLERLPLPLDAFEHRPTDVEPLFLGFECHAAIYERIGGYDYYAYLEDDLTLRDPWFFAKLAWFNGHLGDDLLLQPNRYEVALRGAVDKAYVDGDLPARVTARYQDVNEIPTLRSEFLNRPVRFVRPTNPHSGAFFLNDRQLRAWAARGDFLDRDIGFVGPLESAATLGVMKAFRLYKPAQENAAFLEIEHHGAGFLGLIKHAADVRGTGSTGAPSGRGRTSSSR
jgi:hypothetical protein